VTPRRLAAAVAVAIALTPLPARAAPTFDLVSVDHGPGAAATYYPHTAISGNGRFVVYKAVWNDAAPPVFDLPVPCCLDGVPRTNEELWYRDLQTRKQIKIITAACCVQSITISRDGRYVVFATWVSTLVPGDKNESSDVFVWDAKTQKLSRIVGVAGQELNKGADNGVITPDGGTVVYVSRSDVLNKRNQQAPPCSIYKYSLKTRKTTPVVVGGVPICAFPADVATSSDGRYLAITTMDAYVREDTKGLDVYWVDTVGKRLQLMSETGAATTNGANETTESPTIDGSGRKVAFVSGMSTPFSLRIERTVLLRDVPTGRLIDVSTGLAAVGATATEDPQLSEDGNWITFLDNHGEVPGAQTFDGHAVYIRDLRKDITTTERLEPLASCTDQDCTHPISSHAVPNSNGKVVVYITSSGLAQGDDDHSLDVYVVRR